ETRPDVFAGGLSAGAKRRKIHAGDLPVLHTDDAVDERGFDVVRDAALDQTLDGIAHGAPAQRVAPGDVDDGDVGLRPRRQPPEIVAAERARATQRGGREYIGGRGCAEIAAGDLAEVGRRAHLHDHVARIGVAAECDVDAGIAIALPRVQRAAAPRDVHRAVRNGYAVASHQLH